MTVQHAASGSIAEDLFIELFSKAFGAEKAGYLYSQYHFYDIYQNSRYADFLLESSGRRVAIEIDDEGSHHKSLVASGKFYDDLLKQNSMIYMGWDVYRWAVRQMQLQPETVKGELRVFLGSRPRLQEIEDYLPTRKGRALEVASLELKEHQKEALEALRAMRERRETIALLCHATGTGKTVTAGLTAMPERMDDRSILEILFPHFKFGNNIFDLGRFAVAAIYGGNRKTWQILLPTFRFGSNIQKYGP